MLNCDLELEQQARLRQFEFELEQMSVEQLKETLLGAMRLMYMKDNVIKDLVKQACWTGAGEIGNDSSRH